MNRSSVLKIILIILFAVIIYEAVGQFNRAVPLPAISVYELKAYKESLEVKVTELSKELADKKNELAGLDQKLSELELQYARLIAENEKITGRINSLTQAAQK